jgi:hypothetical protein
MPVATPKPLSDQIEELAGELFDEEILGETLALKCRYSYLHGRIQSRQDKNEEVDDANMQMLNDLEEQLIGEGIRPSSVIEV